MVISKIIETSVGADYADEPIHPDTRRGRFIGLGGYSAIRIIE